MDRVKPNEKKKQGERVNKREKNNIQRCKWLWKPIIMKNLKFDAHNNMMRYNINFGVVRNSIGQRAIWK